MLRQGTCDQPGCGRTGRVIAKYLPSSGNWCDQCNAKRLTNGRSPVRTSYSTSHPFAKKNMNMSRRKVTTGEGALFFTIWNTRPHVSFITGKPLEAEARAWYFAHVLPKSTYGRFRLFDKNIVLLAREEHEAWDTTDRKALREDPKWDKMFALEAELKEMYYQKL